MKLAVLPGDEIGPEIVDAALEVLRRADQEFGLDLEFDLQEVGMAAHRRYGTTMPDAALAAARSEEHTSELQSLMRISYAVFCLKKKKTKTSNTHINTTIKHKHTNRRHTQKY